MFLKASLGVNILGLIAVATTALIGCKVGGSDLAAADAPGTLYVDIPQATSGSSYNLLFAAAKTAATLGVCIPNNDNCAPTVSGYQAGTMVYVNNTTKFFKLSAPTVISDGMKLTIVSTDSSQRVLETRTIAIQNSPANQANPATQVASGTPAQNGAGTPAQNGAGTPAQNGAGTPAQNGSGTPAQSTPNGSGSAVTMLQQL